MVESQPFMVGRQSEVNHFADLVAGRTAHTWLNIYGPGGIGKTVVGQKMRAYAEARGWPLAFVDGLVEEMAPMQLLAHLGETLAARPDLEEQLASFRRQLDDYRLVQQLLEIGGGVANLYSPTGPPNQPEMLAQLLANLARAAPVAVQQMVANRFSVERYLRRVEKDLTGSLSDGLGAAVAPVTILLDTYEAIEGHDDWIQRRLARSLPAGVRLVVLGRNALPKVNFEWQEWGERLRVMELPELAADETKAYLSHHGLSDEAAQKQIYRFTGGYPLLLVLVVHLAREAGGWEQVAAMRYEGDRDWVAGRLLDRILREQRVAEVRAFLEKGVVARWFSPDVVSVILEVSAADGRLIYDKLARHSFVERHPRGLKFHDKVRELLEARLRFSDPAGHEAINRRLMAYYAARADIQEDRGATGPVQPDETAASPKSFGEWLRYYRRQSTDPERGGLLTQERLAEWLAREPNCPEVSHATVSLWENDRATIAIQDRSILAGLLRVLHRCGGLKTVEEANQWLWAGGYRPLDRNEQRIFAGRP